ncbi:MAG: ParB/RepB/Spo0J family partition protein [Phenylobacterium sp.]|uniref:ParB/RepB/Spo0J family partition protein n=1 Tax=Phenylobacterium sp. TaxID=1871053 RepID=UPI001A470C6E|nr:ParB/Srx family N-terminal domain-containing protein [Phenylobacterium sp.]MBL8772207.1 ParB/RepB/Spo0J family partition protein [Phenylobacterium sp.]
MNAVTVIESGSVLDIPLNKLKKSPKNARRTPHGEAAIEALAASIAAKGLLQAPVVEPEVDGEGGPTGCYLVTIGEGRRLALLLRAKRKEIRKTEPVRCVVDTANDPHEISLDENVTRTDMHPADQFEAFRKLAEDQGFGAEEIAARFGVSAHVVRQRLRLGAVAPKLMALYREGTLTLDQLMAFAVTEDHARQEQVYEQLSWNRSPQLIRRAMTEAKVPAADRRAVFVGIEAYAEAGGTILRDLFTEDGGGWLEDVGLLDRLALEKLDREAAELREAEGWKWAEPALEYPHGHGFRRVYPNFVERSEEDAARKSALSDELEDLNAQWEATEDLPPDVEAQFAKLEEELAALGDTYAYDPDDVSRGGVLVVLGHDGAARIERGLIRPEDEAPEPEADDEDDGEGASPVASEAGDAQPSGPGDVSEPVEDEGAPLSERLVLDLTAYRTIGLRDAVGADPNLALVALVHALAVKTFYPPYAQASCVDVKLVSAFLDGHAPGVSESPAGRRIGERHDAWATRLPQEAEDAWAYVFGLGSGDLLDLLAHCVSLGINAVHNPLDRKPAAWAHADALAQAADLDMRTTWTPTVASYLGRVTKAKIVDAVTEAVGGEAVQRLDGLKKPDMAEAAETSLAPTRWLPALLRTPRPEPKAEAEPDVTAIAAE